MGSGDVDGDGETLRGGGIPLPGARMDELEAGASGGARPDGPRARPARAHPAARRPGGRPRLEPCAVDGRDAPRVARGGILVEAHRDRIADLRLDDSTIVRAGHRHMSHDEAAAAMRAGVMVGMAPQLDGCGATVSKAI